MRKKLLLIFTITLLVTPFAAFAEDDLSSSEKKEIIYDRLELKGVNINNLREMSKEIKAVYSSIDKETLKAMPKEERKDLIRSLKEKARLIRESYIAEHKEIMNQLKAAVRAKVEANKANVKAKVHEKRRKAKEKKNNKGNKNSENSNDDDSNDNEDE